jgi:hypothetical protein
MQELQSIKGRVFAVCTVLIFKEKSESIAGSYVTLKIIDLRLMM